MITFTNSSESTLQMLFNSQPSVTRIKINSSDWPFFFLSWCSSMIISHKIANRKTELNVSQKHQYWSLSNPLTDRFHYNFIQLFFIDFILIPVTILAKKNKCNIMASHVIKEIYSSIMIWTRFSIIMKKNHITYISPIIKIFFCSSMVQLFTNIFIFLIK